MPRPPLFCLAFLLSLCDVATAWAVPEPRSDEEIWALSDLVVIGQVVSITNAGTRDFDGATLFTTKIRVEQVLKGRFPIGGELRFGFDTHQPAPGESGGVLHLGERMRIHLERDAGGYDTFGYECWVPIDPGPQELQSLPQGKGQTIRLPGAFLEPCRRARFSPSVPRPRFWWSPFAHCRYNR